jgi:branched-chain amino acid transport system substrate-binding protein
MRTIARIGLGLAFGLAAPLAGTATAQPAKPCIGATLAMTGPAAHSAVAITIGVQTALDEINEKGGILGQKVEFIRYDDTGQPPRGVDNARRIGQKDNCVVMLGGFHSGTALALREAVQEMGLPWLGIISAGTKIVEHEDGKNEWMFRVSMKDRWAAKFLIGIATERSPTGKIGILYENTGWGQGAVPDLQAALKDRGSKEVGAETFNWADQDMSAQLIRLKDAGADTLIFWGADREANQILRGMEKLDYHPLIVSAWGVGNQLGETAGKLTEGMLVAGTFSWMGQLSPRAKAVYDRMAKGFDLKGPADLKIPSGTANAYDGVYIIKAALEKAGSFDRTKFRDALFQVEYDGIVTSYRPAFEKAKPGFAHPQERYDAIKAESYALLAFHNGVLLPIDQTPYAHKKS